MAESQHGDVIVRCAACKYLKKKCTTECIFAPYYGGEQGAASFAAVHKVFGASNVSKLLSNVPTNHRHEAAATITYEAQARLSNPVYGCVSTILALQQQVAAMQENVSIMQTELINKTFAGANARQTIHQEQHQMLQKPNFNVQPAYSNNSYGSTNNFINMNFNPGFDPTMETAPSSHDLEPFQNSWFFNFEEDH